MKNAGYWLLAGCFILGALCATGCSKPEVKSAGNAHTGDKTNSTSTASETTDGQLSVFDLAAEHWNNAKPNTELKGDIKIDGSSTVYPISEAAAAAFKKLFPNVNTTVGKSGTGGGFKRFQTGETDVSDASRPIKEKEFKACKDSNVAFIELPVAYDGLTIVAHKDNDFLDTLTIDQIKHIFLADRAAKTWKEINDSWPDEEIKIFAPGTDSGTFDYFKEVVAGDDGSFRKGMSTSENDDVLVNGVAGDVYSLGFFGAAYYFQNTDKLKSIKVVNPLTGDAVSPTETTIEDGTYAPFSRPLFIYINRDSINKPQVEQFAEFYLVKAAEFAKDVGYVALPKRVYKAAMDNLIDENTGTHYLTPEMEKRSGPVTDVYSPNNLVK